MPNQQPPPVAPVPIAVRLLDAQTSRVIREEVGHLEVDRIFRLGRDSAADVTVARRRDVSALALIVRLGRVRDRSGTALVEVICRQSRSGSLDVSGGGDFMTLRHGAPPLLLRPDTTYTISLFTPSPVAQLEFTTPASPTDGQQLGSSSGTLTWTLTGHERAGEHPQWLIVAALAVLIERYPDVIPVHDGSPLTPSRALRELVEIMTGHSSTTYYQYQLTEAATAARLDLSPGDQTKQARVAAAYAARFPQNKLEALRARILELSGGED